MSDDPTYDRDAPITLDADPEDILRTLLNTPPDDVVEPDEDDD